MERMGLVFQGGNNTGIFSVYGVWRDIVPRCLRKSRIVWPGPLNGLFSAFDGTFNKYDN